MFLFYPSFFLCSSILFSSLPNFFFFCSLPIVITSLSLERRCLVNPTKKSFDHLSCSCFSTTPRYNMLYLLHSARRLSSLYFSSSVPSSSFFYSFVFFFSIDERRKCGSILSYTANVHRATRTNLTLSSFFPRSFTFFLLFLLDSKFHLPRFIHFYFPLGLTFDVARGFEIDLTERTRGWRIVSRASRDISSLRR